MAYYNVCPNCGSNLDPDEKCDCESVKVRKYEIRKVFRAQLKKDMKFMEADYGKNTGIKYSTSGN